MNFEVSKVLGNKEKIEKFIQSVGDELWAEMLENITEAHKAVAARLEERTNFEKETRETLKVMFDGIGDDELEAMVAGRMKVKYPPVKVVPIEAVKEKGEKQPRENKKFEWFIDGEWRSFGDKGGYPSPKKDKPLYDAMTAGKYKGRAVFKEAGLAAIPPFVREVQSLK